MVRRVHTAGGYRQHLGLRGRHRRRKAVTCRSAVIALFGRTPREGTAGHVATRRGLDPTMRPGGRRADPLGTAGSRAVARRTEPAWTAARRDEAGAWAEHPCHAGSRPGPRRGRVAPKPGLRPLPVTARRSRRFGRQRKERRGHHAARLRVRRSRKGRRIAHHNSATPRPPRVCGARPAVAAPKARRGAPPLPIANPCARRSAASVDCRAWGAARFPARIRRGSPPCRVRR